LTRHRGYFGLAPYQSDYSGGCDKYDKEEIFRDFHGFGSCAAKPLSK
jgi:hypothetical protein